MKITPEKIDKLVAKTQQHIASMSRFDGKWTEIPKWDSKITGSKTNRGNKELALYIDFSGQRPRFLLALTIYESRKEEKETAYFEEETKFLPTIFGALHDIEKRLKSQMTELEIPFRRLQSAYESF